MAIGCRLAIDGATQVEAVDDRARAQVEDLVHRTLDVGLGNVRRAERLDHDRDRLRDADGIGDLDLAAIGQVSGHHVLRNPTRGVRSGAVDLRAVLARERAAAVTAHAAVGVDDDLAPGEAAVAHRPADDEAPSRVDVDLGALGELDPLVSEHGLDDLLGHVATQRGVVDVLGMLRGHDNLLHIHGSAVDVAHRNLRLAVRAQVGQRAVLAHLRQTLAHALCQVNRHRHESLRLLAGIAEHHALVTCAHRLVDIFCLAVLRLERLVDALRDVGRLLVDSVQNAAGRAIEAVLRAIVADLADDVTHDGRHVDIGLCANLARHDDHARCGHGLAGAAHLRHVGGLARRGNVALLLQLGFLLEDRVEDRVGNLIADLVRVTLRHRFGRE